MHTHFRERENHAPRLEFIEMSPALRQALENAIEGLLQLLDAIDGDPDLEDGGDDEPEEDCCEAGDDLGGTCRSTDGARAIAHALLAQASMNDGGRNAGQR